MYPSQCWHHCQRQPVAAVTVDRHGRGQKRFAGEALNAIAVGEGERIVNVVEVDVLVEGNFVEEVDSIAVGALREEGRTAAVVGVGLQVRREIFREELEARFSARLPQ